MKNIIKKELSDVIYDKKSKYMFLCIAGVIIVDAIIGFVIGMYSVVIGNFSDMFKSLDNFIKFLSEQYIPNMAAFLSGNTTGKVLQILLVWLLPVYMLLMYGDKYVREHKIRYSSLVYVRCNKGKIYTSKLVCGFILGFTPTFIGLVINYFLCYILFFFGSWDKGLSAYMDDRVLVKFMFAHPVVGYMGYALIFSIIAGFCMTVCVGLSYVFRGYKILYGVSIGGWLIYIKTKYSAVYVIQPYTEYGFEKIIPSMEILLVALCISIITGYIFGVKREVI